nr:pollen receptor-like kinase 2 [Malus domestica]
MMKMMMMMMKKQCESSSLMLPRALAFFFVLLYVCVASPAGASESETLLKLKDSLQNTDGLTTWTPLTSPCTAQKPNWMGIHCDRRGRVWALQLENMGLKGEINVGLLQDLPDLRTIGFMNNSFEGPLPDLRKIIGLKTVYLTGNKFSGTIPSDWFAGMSSLKKLHMANNQFTGEIPKSLAGLDKLLELSIEGNKFEGKIPDFRQPRLTIFNVSNNKLEGEIPKSLRKLDASSFAGNEDLCGGPLKACSTPSKKPATWIIVLIVIAVIVAIIAIIALLVFLLGRRKKTSESSVEAPPPSTATVQNRAVQKEPEHQASAPGSPENSIKGGNGKKGEQSLKLSFVRDDRERFDMQDLLRASAEVLGSGCFGSSYKAALLTGPVMVVKRYKQMNNVGREEFIEHMRRIGRLGHPNLLPLVAYYYKKEEKLLISDHVLNGSLAAHLHGNQTLDHPSLDWPTRLKIVKGVAHGLRYLYTELPSLVAPHGHLKSSNVLLNESYEPLITDYGLIPVVNQEHAHTLMVAYKSPEYMQSKRVTKKTDVWSFGVLILEILTGKLPTNFLQQGKGSEEDLASWVNSVPRVEWFSQVFDTGMGAGKSSEGEMLKLLKIGLECCEGEVEKRLDLKEVVERIEELERDNPGDSDFFSTCASEGDMMKIVG